MPDLWVFLSPHPAPLPLLRSPPESRCLGVCREVGSVRHPKTPRLTPDTSGMNLEPGECGMNSVSCGNGKLRQWLIDQIDSGKYPGLVWENDEKSIFRIPWKHAGKQDYNREEDAALFKVGLSPRSGLWDTDGAGGMPGGSAVAPRRPDLATCLCRMALLGAHCRRLPAWWPWLCPSVPCVCGMRQPALSHFSVWS